MGVHEISEGFWANISNVPSFNFVKLKTLPNSLACQEKHIQNKQFQKLVHSFSLGSELVIINQAVEAGQPPKTQKHCIFQLHSCYVHMLIAS